MVISLEGFNCFGGQGSIGTKVRERGQVSERDEDVLECSDRVRGTV